MNPIPESPRRRRENAIQRVLGVTLVANLAVSLTKIVLGFVLRNGTIIADGFHSLLDGANNVMGLVAIRLASKPPDEDHPYGHRKFENLAAMIIGGLIMLIAYDVAEEAIRTVMAHVRGVADPDGGPRRASAWHVVALVGTLAVNVVISVYEHRRGRELQSTLLTADALHTRSDAFVTGLSLASLFAAPLAWWIDPLLTAGVLVFLLRAAWEIVRDNIPGLTDRIILDPEEVRSLVDTVEGVMQPHAIRSHGTPNDIHLDLHIVVARDLTAEQTESLEREVRRVLVEKYSGLTFVGIHHQTHQPGENPDRR
jgi:cation diffusion facilitator family transporter